MDQNPLVGVDRWFSLYDFNDQSQVTPDDLKAYDMVIIDPDMHFPLEWLPKKTIKIAYVSVGEAENYRSYWLQIQKASWILEENPNWKGNYLVDLRDEQWHQVLLDQVLPDVIDKGFQGIMMDTLDTSLQLESEDSEQYSGMHAATIQLVKKIKERYPYLHLVSNNGFHILPEIGAYLSGMLVEDIHMMIDFDNNAYVKVSDEDRAYKIDVLKSMQRKFKLPVFNIDYVDASDKQTKAYCIRSSRKLGFHCYVAEANLNQIYSQR